MLRSALLCCAMPCWRRSNLAAASWRLPEEDFQALSSLPTQCRRVERAVAATWQAALHAQTGRGQLHLHGQPACWGGAGGGGGRQSLHVQQLPASQHASLPKECAWRRSAGACTRLARSPTHRLTPPLALLACLPARRQDAGWRLERVPRGALPHAGGAVGHAQRGANQQSVRRSLQHQQPVRGHAWLGVCAPKLGASGGQ